MPINLLVVLYCHCIWSKKKDSIMRELNCQYGINCQILLPYYCWTLYMYLKSRPHLKILERKKFLYQLYGYLYSKASYQFHAFN